MNGRQPTHLDLFSGIGGFALAAQWAGFRTIGFCEIDKYCQKVLQKNFMADTCESGMRARCESSRSREKAAHGSPQIFGNIFDLDGRQFAGVTLITGGFPCQPYSVAGLRRGAADDRAIWPQMLRVVSEARPAWVLGENVPGIISMELDNVLSDLEGIGYATRAFVIGAVAVCAPHRRQRVWVIGRDMADTANYGGGSATPRAGKDVGNCQQQGLEGRDPSQHVELQVGTRSSGSVGETGSGIHEWCDWLPEPAVCELVNGVSDRLVRYAGRVATGIPNRTAKLEALGNAIVPHLAYELLREIGRFTG